MPFANGLYSSYIENFNLSTGYQLVYGIIFKLEPSDTMVITLDLRHLRQIPIINNTKDNKSFEFINDW